MKDEQFQNARLRIDYRVQNADHQDTVAVLVALVDAVLLLAEVINTKPQGGE